MSTPSVTFDDVFRRATGHAPYAYQRRLATDAEWPDIVRVPTGSGKTAAVVMAWLWKSLFAHPAVRQMTPHRLIYCLPQRSLVRQTASVIREWLKNLDLAADVPVHVLMGGALAEGWEVWPAQRQILVGTQDQLLSRALGRGYGISRYRWPMHFALVNNDVLWVVDEPQLFGNGLATTSQLAAFRQMFGTFGPSHTVWVSATIRPEWLATVDHRPLAERAVVLELDADDARQLELRLNAPKPLQESGLILTAEDAKKPGSYVERLAEYVKVHRAQGVLTLVVVNRVARAQQVAERLRAIHAAPIIRLVHSRFRAVDRQQLDTELKSLEQQDAILVATQAVEAGLDLSAEVLITELAPWPALVQRFGRCNRNGMAREPAVHWVNLADDAMCATPYSPEELAAARTRLRALTDVGPVNLPPVEEDMLPAQVLRRRDLLALFDTTPDMSGADIDISPYVRDAADTDVTVWWRRWEGDEPPADLARPHPDEACRVSIAMLREYLASKQKGATRSAWTWDPLMGRWRELDRTRLFSGQWVLLRADQGGYRPDLGFAPNSWDPVPEVPPPTAMRTFAEDQHDADEDNAQVVASPVELGVHLMDAWREAQLLAEELAGLAELGTFMPLVQEAARQHDRGKAHPLFQARLATVMQDGAEAENPGAVQAVEDRPLLAKSGSSGKVPVVTVEIRQMKRSSRGFRHELASALAYLQDVPVEERNDPSRRLVAYLIAAHHGKVRVQIQSVPTETVPDMGILFARGVWQGDELPDVTLPDGTVLPRCVLDLSCMQLGDERQDGATVDSWVLGITRLLEDLGPFRLAYLETLVRIADWRASEKEVPLSHA
ncbi:MAG: CRISPR-associated helicase Cas3' [Thermoflavifilum sp.]|nr:CRISPR-associated helicase Cas3' [Thermoflavifilum sp.]MCL6515268.1 CRISPR-associated helicase Cas3' [Alicyclobacillus sp.]